MARLRFNGLSGVLGGSLTSGATSVTFASKLTHVGGDVPTITGSDYIPLSILDANGKCAEVVHVTAYTSGSTSATIARGKEGSSGVAHDNGRVFVNGGLVDDASAFRSLYYCQGSAAGNYTTSSATNVDMDGTNLVRNVPASTGDLVLVTFTAMVWASAPADVTIDIQSNGVTVVDVPVNVNAAVAYRSPTLSNVITVTSGMISAGVMPFKVRWRTNSGTATVGNAPTNRPLLTVRHLN